MKMSGEVNDRVLITGGTGSFGQTMLRRLLKSGISEVRVLSRDEEKQDVLRNTLRDDRVRFYIGDVRDRDAVDRAMRGVQNVFHAAALKQVPSCEFFPQEAVRTNVLGSENVIRSAIAHNVASLVCLSTDKAVFPVNAMGLSKAMMEKTALAAARELGPNARTTISTVRYGNVMYSRGSVIPLFVAQIRDGRPITVTEPAMTRFLMPLRDSVGLVDLAFAEARQGDVMIKKAPAATLEALIAALKLLFDAPDHPVEVIGWRHAEKLYETLASAQEIARAEDLGGHLRIRPDDRSLTYRSSDSDDVPARGEDFHSHNARRLDVDAVKTLLLSLPELRAELGERAVAA